MTNLVGRTLLSRYRLDAFLGRGGMAEVYQAWDTHRSTYLALKRLHDDLAEDKVFIRRFRQEARVLEALQHPHIVRFYGLEQAEGMVFILLDYIDGQSLRKLIFNRPAPFSVEGALELLRPIGAALHFAHSQNLVHCDLKPANVLIDRAGRVFLNDFGIARIVESATVTLAGAGTPAYMSPEQCRAEAVDARSDIYSLGVILYEMVTGGERPFAGDTAPGGGSTAEKVRWEHLHAEPAPPSRRNRALTPAVDAAVLCALAKNPQDRFPSAMAFLEALARETSAAHTKPTLLPEPAVPLNPGTEIAQPVARPVTNPRQWGLWVTAGLVALMLIGVGFLWALGRGVGAPESPTLAATVTSGLPIATANLAAAAVSLATETPSPTALPTSTPILAASPTASTVKVFWDTTHGPRQGSSGAYTPNDLYSDLVEALAGGDISIATNGDWSRLSDYQIVVLAATSAEKRAVTSDEADAVEVFVQGGGGLLLLGERADFPNNLQPVAARFGLGLGGRLVSGATSFADHFALNGVSRVDFLDGGALVVTPPSMAVAWDDAPVMAVCECGAGRVVALADSNLWDNRKLAQAGNRQLAVNVFKWLARHGD